MSVPVFRFAPSPNGRLHLGHALSAWLNYDAALKRAGRFLVRIEDIDQIRCTPGKQRDMLEDLHWLGLDWEKPVYRQSDHFALYAAALQTLEDKGLAYRAYLTRSEIKAFVTSYEASGKVWSRDPDGAPLYPGDEAILSRTQLAERREKNTQFAVRLNMQAALNEVKQSLSWWEGASQWPEKQQRWMKGTRIAADPSIWGDVILARKDTPTSYHLSVVLDDARQNITDVIRGQDLYQATAIHRLLQDLLGLPEPRYRHHRLILDGNGAKLSKSTSATSLQALRAAGWNASRVLKEVGMFQSPSL